MASGMTISFRPTMVRANAGGSKRDRSRKSAGNWWSPLFGWGSEEADYMDGGEGDPASLKKASEPYSAGKDGRRRISLFTEEKAREMRKRMMETESFHDAMYHSAIASRLARDMRRSSG